MRDTFEARNYLERELPALLGRSRCDKRAVIQWVVIDRQDCDFAYHFGDDGVVVSQEIAGESDLTLAFVSADLRAFSERTLDVARALRTRRLKITGDETLLAWMAERL